MYRLLVTILLVLFAATPIRAQDDAPEPEAEEPTETAAPDPTEMISDEEIEELLGLDEDYADLEDEDFDPTENVRFAQSIPFPTDI